MPQAMNDSKKSKQWSSAERRKRQVEDEMERRAKEDSASQKIQQLERGRQGRKAAAEAKAKKEARVRISPRDEGPANTPQPVPKPEATSYEARGLRFDSACTIQRMVRRYLAVTEMNRVKFQLFMSDRTRLAVENREQAERDLEERQHNTAATKIQGSYRGRKARLEADRRRQNRKAVIETRLQREKSEEGGD